MKIKRIEHIAIVVESMEPMHALFGEKLGLALGSTQSFASGTQIKMYQAGDCQIELVHNRAEGSLPANWIKEKGQGLFHMCLEVDDIDGALFELRNKGIRSLDKEPRPGHDGARVVFLDPATTGGLLIELAAAASGTSLIDARRCRCG